MSEDRREIVRHNLQLDGRTVRGVGGLEDLPSQWWRVESGRMWDGYTSTTDDLSSSERPVECPDDTPH